MQSSPLPLLVSCDEPGSGITPDGEDVAPSVSEVASPNITPGPGSYATQQSIAITTSTPDAVIRYNFTTDGTLPSEPIESSPRYTAPIPILQNDGDLFAISARAFRDGWNPSPVAVGYYSRGVAPAGTVSRAGDADLLIPGDYGEALSIQLNTTLSGAQIYYTFTRYGGGETTTAFNTEPADPTLAASNPILYDGTAISVLAAEGDWFRVKAFVRKDGYVDSPVLNALYTWRIDAPAITPAGGNYDDQQTLTMSGAPTIHYEATTNGSRPTDPTLASTTYSTSFPILTDTPSRYRIKAFAVDGNKTPSLVSERSYFRGVVSNPTFTPTSYNVLTTDSLTISTTTDAATIYYTTDGSTPDNTSETYSTPVSFGSLGVGTHTIMAIGIRDTYIDSAVTTRSFNVSLPAAVAPTFSPASGNVLTTDSLTMSTTTDSATIHYTTDGSTPDNTSATYSTPVSFGSLGAGIHTIKAIAIHSDYSNSPVTTASFTVPQVATPIVSPAGLLTFDSGQNLTITTATDGATIYYISTTDTSTEPADPSVSGNSPSTYSRCHQHYCQRER